MKAVPLEIEITKSCHRKLVRWATSTKKEITFICGGPSINRITYVKRLRNAAIITSAFCMRNERQFKYDLNKLNCLGLKHLFNGHSHPNGLSHPSYYDCLWLRGKLEIIIVVGKETEVTAWHIKKTVSQTKKTGRVKLQPVPK